MLNCTFVLYGSGRHQYLQSQKDAAITTTLSYISRVVYQLVLGTTKIGICVMYLRVFQDRTSKIIVYSLMAFIAAFTLPLTIYVIIQCIPGGEGSPLELFVKCHRNSPDLLTSAACNVLADVLLLIFIVPRICECLLQVLLFF